MLQERELKLILIQMFLYDSHTDSADFEISSFLRQLKLKNTKLNSKFKLAMYKKSTIMF